MIVGWRVQSSEMYRFPSNDSVVVENLYGLTLWRKHLNENRIGRHYVGFTMKIHYEFTMTTSSLLEKRGILILRIFVQMDPWKTWIPEDSCSHPLEKNMTPNRVLWST